MSRQPKSEEKPVPSSKRSRPADQSAELSEKQLSEVTGGKLPGRWKAGDVTLTRG
jgi:bacteriocin-like protein